MYTNRLLHGNTNQNRFSHSSIFLDMVKRFLIKKNLFTLDYIVKCFDYYIKLNNFNQNKENLEFSRNEFSQYDILLLDYIKEQSNNPSKEKNKNISLLAFIYVYGCNHTFDENNNTMFFVPILENIYSSLDQCDKIKFFHSIWKTDILKITNLKYGAENSKTFYRDVIKTLSMEEKIYLIKTTDGIILEKFWKNILKSVINTPCQVSLVKEWFGATKLIALKVPNIYENISLSKLWHLYFTKIIKKSEMESLITKIQCNNKLFNFKKFSYLMELLPNHPFILFFNKENIAQSNLAILNNRINGSIANFIAIDIDNFKYIGNLFPVTYEMFLYANSLEMIEKLLLHNSFKIKNFLKYLHLIKIFQKTDKNVFGNFLAKVIEKSTILQNEILNLNELDINPNIVMLTHYFYHQPKNLCQNNSYSYIFKIFEYFFFDIPIKYSISTDKIDDFKDMIIKLLKISEAYDYYSFFKNFSLTVIPIQINDELWECPIFYCRESNNKYWIIDSKKSKHINHPNPEREDIKIIVKNFPRTEYLLNFNNLYAQLMNIEGIEKVEQLLNDLNNLFFENTNKNFLMSIKNNLCDCILHIHKKFYHLKITQIFLDNFCKFIPKEFLDFVESNSLILQILKPFIIEIKIQNDFNKFENKFTNIYSARYSELNNLFLSVPNDNKPLKQYLQNQIDNLKNNIIKELLSESQYYQCNCCFEIGEKKYFSGFANCSHYVCSSCADKIHSCPECRETIGKKRNLRSDVIGDMVELISERIVVPKI